MDELELKDTMSLEGSAFQSRLPYNEMISLEEATFPDVLPKFSAGYNTYLMLRNTMLKLWLENPKEELIVEAVVSYLNSVNQLTDGNLCSRVHKFLDRHGYINFGIFTQHSKVQLDKKAKIIVLGAGMAGLSVARKLTSLGMDVTVIEARDHVGGRVASYRKGKYVADLGAMVVTGLGGNPVNVIRKQVNMELHQIKQDCPLFETGGKRVPKEKDELVEHEFNKLLEASARLSQETSRNPKWKNLSLGEAFELVIQVQEKRVKEKLISHWKKISELQCNMKDVLSRMHELETTSVKLRDEVALLEETKDTNISDKFKLKCKLRDWRAVCKEYDIISVKRQKLESEILHLESNQPSDIYLSSKDRQLLDWHLANLEFANATTLDKLSLQHWNQDDPYEFSGSHMVVKNGYSTMPTAYAESLNIKLQTAVRKIKYSETGCQVIVQSTNVNSSETTLDCDAVVCALPLGVLRPPDPELDHGPSIEFSPPLPSWKTDAINRLGFGNLNKVILCFDRAFWDTNASLFGHIGATTSSRGELFLFWSIYKAPVLIALVAGSAAKVMEHIGDGVVEARAVAVLRGIFGVENVPEPISCTVTRWGSDPWCRGSYSYIATGSTGKDYDVMAEPVDSLGTPFEKVMEKGKPRLFFAGEHTMRNYPATVHGAMMSGMREAARIADIFLGSLTPPNTTSGRKTSPSKL